MTEIDTEKDFFLFPHGNMGLKQKITDVLIAKWCTEAKITMGVGTKVGNVGDYMVQYLLLKHLSTTQPCLPVLLLQL